MEMEMMSVHKHFHSVMSTNPKIDQLNYGYRKYNTSIVLTVLKMYITRYMLSAKPYFVKMKDVNVTLHIM